MDEPQRHEPMRYCGGAVDRRRIALPGDLGCRRNRIGWLDGRPSREVGIGQDDVVNLLITLNSSRTFEEFLREI